LNPAFAWSFHLFRREGQTDSLRKKQTMKITHGATIFRDPAPGLRPTGDVWQDEVRTGLSPQHHAMPVTFWPGSRTAWHTHPLRQAVHVLSGRGWAQIEGEPAKMIYPGDSVWIEAGELHWHGAADDEILITSWCLAPSPGIDAHGGDLGWVEQVREAEC
jgi:quercetin dioxygenase-like cupin family protein